ncbi:MAG: hypothetical protein NDJ89_00380 [Oligoflexia bacterium]|nr:hypothetical protein [Oligoflexia bacterium]
MSLNNPQPFIERVGGYSIAGKVFVLGEYAVLGGGPAVIAAIGPRFRAKVDARAPDPFGTTASFERFHPMSPVARLLDWAGDLRAPRLELDFEDPFEGSGGFGGSTAEFALAYRALAGFERWDGGWERAWRLYRELTIGAARTGRPPSGADLVAQWEGGVVLFEDGLGSPRAESLWKCFDWESFLVFSAAGQEGRKVATHEHLAALEDQEAFAALMAALRIPLAQGIVAIRENDPVRLGEALGDYAEALRAAGLEIAATTEDRRALSALPGVLGVKGAGALQADALVVLLQPECPHRESVIEEAKARNLALVSDGIRYEPGVSCH